MNDSRISKSVENIGSGYSYPNMGLIDSKTVDSAEDTANVINEVEVEAPDYKNR